MKSSRGNSFRLQRLINTIPTRRETIDYHPTQTLKLAALNSINRGTKYNQLQFLTGSNLHKLRVQPTQGTQNTLYFAASQNFKEIRKKYDDTKKQKLEEQQTITRLKQDIKKFQLCRAEYLNKIEDGKNIVSKLSNQLQAKKNLLQEALTDKKVLLNLQARHKKDRIFYNQTKFNLSQQLQFLKKQLNLFNTDGQHIEQSADRTTKLCEKYLKQLGQQDKERKMHLNNLESMRLQKQKCKNTNLIRQMQIMQIASRAMQDKDQNEKMWRKIYLTHTLVSRLLKDKIEIEMNKFSTVEFAFKTIKTATGISNAKTFIQRYLNKQREYGQLLGKIAINQQRILSLKGQVQYLQKQSKQLDLQQQTINNMKQKHIGLYNELKQLDICGNKVKHIQSHKSKTTMWIQKQIKKFRNIISNDIQFEIKDKSNQSLCNGLKKILSLISIEIDNYTQKKQEYIDSTTVLGLTQKDNEKLFRIQPKKARKNSLGEQILDIDEQQTTIGIINEQFEIVEHEREQLIKHNQKFMKQLRKKKQEQRRILAQKMFEKEKKQKVVKPAEIKKQEDN